MGRDDLLYLCTLVVIVSSAATLFCLLLHVKYSILAAVLKVEGEVLKSRLQVIALQVMVRDLDDGLPEAEKEESDA